MLAVHQSYMYLYMHLSSLQHSWYYHTFILLMMYLPTVAFIQGSTSDVANDCLQKAIWNQDVA